MVESVRDSLVVVAIPSEDDHVWKVSSEKVPHLTLLYLGEQEIGPDTARMAEFIEHAASTTLNRFGLSVDRRGELGEDKADVLFFEEGYFIKDLKRFRSYLLAHEPINKAYHSVEQYPTWTPHLTLGYPETPAKPDDRDYGISWVNFDRIALWTGDSEGFEVQLKNEYSDSVSMSEQVDNFLAHYGVKGMKWGRRRSDTELARAREATPVEVTVKPGKKIVTKGGKFHSPSEEAINTAIARQKAKASTTSALSNTELKAAVQRMQLEQQFTQLSSGRQSAGKKFVSKLLGNTAQQQAQRVANNVATEKVDEFMKKQSQAK